MMSLRPGMRVLDIGCGVGGPAREIARFSGARITGVNNNDFQIARARKYTAKAGLEDQVDYAKGDFMSLSEQFGEGQYDASEFIDIDRHRAHMSSLRHRGYRACPYFRGYLRRDLQVPEARRCRALLPPIFEIFS